MKLLAISFLLLCLAAPACSAGLPRRHPPGGPFAGSPPPGSGNGPWGLDAVFAGGLAAGLLAAGLWRWLGLRRRLGRPGGRGLSRELGRLKQALGLVEEVLGRGGGRVVRLDRWRRERERKRL